MRPAVFLFLFLFLLLGSCTSQSSKNNVFLSQPENLTADSIQVPPTLLSVSRLFIAQDRLVAYEPQKDTLFSFWQLPDCRYLFSAGRKGEGPDDFLMLDKVFIETPQGFKAFELSSNKIKELKTDDYNRLKVVAEKRLEANQMPLNRFLFLADSSYCFFSRDEQYEYVLLNKKGETHPFSPYPEGVLEMKEGDMKPFVYNKLTVAKPDGEKFAAFYAYAKMIRLYSRDGEMLKEILLEKPAAASEEGMRVAYYSSYPYATDTYIYVLSKLDGRQVLEVWTWEGEMAARYFLDKKIDSFAVSEKYNMLYAINRDREDVIYTIKLN